MNAIPFLKSFEELSLKYITESNKLFVLDQRKLPDVEDWIDVNSPEEMCVLIKQLSIRGAPMIGIGAATAIAQFAIKGASQEDILTAIAMLREARPTAVNLMNNLDEMLQVDSQEKDYSPVKLGQIAERIRLNEVESSDAMAKFGASLIKEGDSILTHCNTGGLATAGKGTAFGVIYEAHLQGKKIHVFVDETRPLLQGGRLTTYELKRCGIPYTLICDNMAAFLMKQGKINRIFVGADRIALNGDFANKIGTYSVAVAAKHHNVPFHPVAPLSTVDFNCPSGDEIPIEQRKPEEVLGYRDLRWAPKDADVYNPAFDVTPADLVESWIFNTGIYTRQQLKDGALLKLKKQ